MRLGAPPRQAYVMNHVDFGRGAIYRLGEISPNFMWFGVSRKSTLPAEENHFVRVKAFGAPPGEAPDDRHRNVCARIGAEGLGHTCL
jgi:hypothetical protein